jgi:hydroxypyruvate isomerase
LGLTLRGFATNMAPVRSIDRHRHRQTRFPTQVIMPKFSANLGFLWPDRPLVDRFEAAAKAGFRAVEMHWPYDLAPEHVSDRCASLGLRILGINTLRGDTGKGEFGLAAQTGREAEFKAHFRQALDWGRVAGASAIHVMAGVATSAQRPQACRTLVSNLIWAAQSAPDMTLLLEALNPRDNPDYLYSTVAETAGIIADVGAPNVRIMFDVYHVGVAEGDIFTRFAAYQPLIGHVQIAAVPSRAEPDEGEIAYANVFRELDRRGYDGWVGCEYRPRGATDAGLDWTRTLGVSL